MPLHPLKKSSIEIGSKRLTAASGAIVIVRLSSRSLLPNQSYTAIVIVTLSIAFSASEIE